MSNFHTQNFFLFFFFEGGGLVGREVGEEGVRGHVPLKYFTEKFHMFVDRCDSAVGAVRV